MNYKMIASDLDGTLLHDLSTVSAENYKAIAEYKRMGGEVVPTSGRCFYEMPKALRECDDIRFYISSNGAVVRDKLTGKRDEQLISNELFEKAKAIFFEYEVFFSVHAEDVGYFASENDSWEKARYYNLTRYFFDHMHANSCKTDDWDKSFPHERGIEMMVVFFRRQEDLEECVERIKALGGLVVTSSENFNVEIISQGATKGDGVRRLAKTLGLKTEDIIGVGDSPNDVPLLNSVGMPLAVSNAAEPLKAVARKVICSHEEHIVKYILDNIIE